VESVGDIVTATRWGSRVGLEHKLRVLLVFVAVSTLGGVAASVDARAQATVGMVTKVENQAYVGTEAAAVGTIVHLNDSLRTGATSRLQVTFRDQTNLTLGENASVVVDRYVFDPDAGIGEATLNATKGAFRLATGRLSEMRNKDIKVKTPLAALAVRGTDFWWGRTKGQFGVLLVHNSRVEVRQEDCREEDTDDDRRRCRCAVTLDEAEEGTYLDEDGCPGNPRHWSPGEVDAALSQTSFSVASLGATQAIPAVAVAATLGAFVVSADLLEGDQPASP